MARKQKRPCSVPTEACLSFLYHTENKTGEGGRDRETQFLPSDAVLYPGPESGPRFCFKSGFTNCWSSRFLRRILGPLSGPENGTAFMRCLEPCKTGPPGANFRRAGEASLDGPDDLRLKLEAFAKGPLDLPGNHSRRQKGKPHEPMHPHGE